MSRHKVTLRQKDVSRLMREKKQQTILKNKAKPRKKG